MPNFFCFPMLRHLAEPFDAGGFELGMRIKAGGAGSFGRQAARDRARDERGALFLQLLDQLPFLRHQRVQLRRLAVKKIGDGALFGDIWPSTPKAINVLWTYSLMAACD